MKIKIKNTSVRIAIAIFLLGSFALTLPASVMIEPGKGTFSETSDWDIPDKSPTGEYALSGVSSDYYSTRGYGFFLGPNLGGRIDLME